MPALELVTPYADTELKDVMHFQSADIMYLCHGSYPVRKLSRTNLNPDIFTLTQVNFDPPATIQDEPTGTDLGGGTLTPGGITGSGITFTAQNSVFLAGDVGRLIVSGGSRGIIKTWVSGTQVTVDIIDNFANTGPIPAANWRLVLSPQTNLDPSGKKKGAFITLTAVADAFRAVDVGKWIALYGGLVKIEQVDSATVAKGTIKAELRDSADDDPGATPAWTLEIAAWSASLGYPVAGCFYQERMWLVMGQKIFGSKTGDFENFAKGSDADAAIIRTISDDQINPILWIKGMRSLQLATGSAAYEVTATNDKALTPSDFNVKLVGTRGSARILPVRTGGVLLYVQFGQRKVRELVFDFVTDKYKSPSLLMLAEHLTQDAYITDVAYQQEPDSIVWALRNDGILLGLVYQEDENVIGWSRHATRGAYKSICVVPRPTYGKDWLWCAVNRIVNDLEETYIEYFEPNAVATGREWNDIQTHSAKLVIPSPSFICSGLDHLEGETVRVIGDGMLFKDSVVASGQITLDPQIAVSKVEIGLDYNSRVIPLEPIVTAEQRGPLMPRGYSEAGVRIRRSLGLSVNGEQLIFRKPEHAQGEQVPLQRGKKCVNNFGYDPFGRVVIEQTLPFPAEVMNVMGTLHIGERSLCDTVDDVSIDAGLGELGLGDAENTATFFASLCGGLANIVDLIQVWNPPSGNWRASWGGVNAKGEVKGVWGPDFASYNTNCTVYEFTKDGRSEIAKPVVPDAPGGNITVVHSDEMSFAMFEAVVTDRVWYFSTADLATFQEYSLDRVTCDIVVKNGNDMYWLVNNAILAADADKRHVLRMAFNDAVIPTTILVDSTTVNANSTSCIDLIRSAGFLWALVATATGPKILKLDKTSIALDTTIDITSLTDAQAIYAISDTQLMIFCNSAGNGVRFYLLNVGSSPTLLNTNFLDSFGGDGFNRWSMVVKDRLIYVGYQGFAGLSTAIHVYCW